MDPNAPQLDGTGEIRLESADRASGYFTTRSETRPATERAHVRCLLARRSGGPEHPGRARRSATRGVDRRAAEELEVDHKRLKVC